jgi:MFS family permease
LISLPATFTAPFRTRGFIWLWASSSFGTLGMIISQLALGWIVLQQTNSSAAVGAVYAARFTPPMILGLPAGLIADMFDRRKLLILANLGSAIIPFIAMGIASMGRLSFAALLAIAIGFGIFDALRTTASQAYVYDTVGTRQATSAITLSLLAGQVFGILAGLAGGALLDQYGIIVAFLALGVIDLAAAGLLLPIHGQVVQQRLLSRDWNEVVRASVLLSRNGTVRLLAVVIAATEVFAFSSATLLPTFARDVFASGASGLGSLYVARSVGGTICLFVLASLPRQAQGRRLLLALCALFGASLIGFSAAAGFHLALVLAVLTGVSIAGIDALALALLQHNVADDQRGSAIGVWLLSTGFGPFGDLEIGAAAAMIGAPLAQAVNGAVLVAIIIGLSLTRSAQEADGSAEPL